jgi:hypothetical protein
VHSIASSRFAPTKLFASEGGATMRTVPSQSVWTVLSPSERDVVTLSVTRAA